MNLSLLNLPFPTLLQGAAERQFKEKNRSLVYIARGLQDGLREDAKEHGNYDLSPKYTPSLPLRRSKAQDGDLAQAENQNFLFQHSPRVYIY